MEAHIRLVLFRGQLEHMTGHDVFWDAEVPYLDICKDMFRRIMRNRRRVLWLQLHQYDTVVSPT